MGQAKRRKKLDPYYGQPPAVPAIVEHISPGSQLEALLLDVSNDCPGASVFAISVELLRQKRKVDIACRLVLTGKRKVNSQIIANESLGLSDRELDRLKIDIARLIERSAGEKKIILYDLFGLGPSSGLRRAKPIPQKLSVSAGDN